jgi:hypothetical protein
MFFNHDRDYADEPRVLRVQPLKAAIRKHGDSRAEAVANGHEGRERSSAQYSPALQVAEPLQVRRRGPLAACLHARRVGQKSNPTRAMKKSASERGASGGVTRACT